MNSNRNNKKYGTFIKLALPTVRFIISFTQIRTRWGKRKNDLSISLKSFYLKKMHLTENYMQLTITLI